MIETVRQLIARLGDEVENGRLWMEIRSLDDDCHLVAGSVECDDDRVAFDDDSGFRNVLAFQSIKAVWSGRQGAVDGATTFVVHPFLPEPVPVERWRIAS